MAKIQNEPNMVTPGTNPSTSGQPYHEVPDMIQESVEITAKINKLRDLHPKMKNVLNRNDGAVQHYRDTTKEWDPHGPVALEEYEKGSVEYRGEGLLPEDQTRGEQVMDSARLKEHNLPAGKTQ